MRMHLSTFQRYPFSSFKSQVFKLRTQLHHTLVTLDALDALDPLDTLDAISTSYLFLEGVGSFGPSDNLIKFRFLNNRLLFLSFPNISGYSYG